MQPNQKPFTCIWNAHIIKMKWPQNMSRVLKFGLFETKIPRNKAKERKSAAYVVCILCVALDGVWVLTFKSAWVRVYVYFRFCMYRWYITWYIIIVSFSKVINLFLWTFLHNDIVPEIPFGSYISGAVVTTYAHLFSSRTMPVCLTMLCSPWLECVGCVCVYVVTLTCNVNCEYDCWYLRQLLFRICAAVVGQLCSYGLIDVFNRIGFVFVCILRVGFLTYEKSFQRDSLNTCVFFLLVLFCSD